MRMNRVMTWLAAERRRASSVRVRDICASTSPLSADSIASVSWTSLSKRAFRRGTSGTTARAMRGDREMLRDEEARDHAGGLGAG